MADLYGVDLSFAADLQINAIGDFDTISGTANVKDALMRRLITVPGSLAHRPTYGCGLASFQNAPMTLDVKRQIARRIAVQFPQDPRVDSVTNVSVSSTDGTPQTVVVTVNVVIKGIGAQTFTYTPFTGLVV